MVTGMEVLLEIIYDEDDIVHQACTYREVWVMYLSVGADGGGYTTSVPIKMRTLSLGARGTHARTGWFDEMHNLCAIFAPDGTYQQSDQQK